MGKLIAAQELPWRRFWTPWGEQINCGFDGRGFLDDPEDEFGKIHNPKVLTIEELSNFQVFVLSGQPGLGKTVETGKLERQLRSICHQPDEVVSFHCREIGSDDALRHRTVASPCWIAARKAGGKVTLIIDGVDEGLRKVPEFIHALSGWLRTDAIDKLQVILTCRCAEWNEAEGNQLFQLWPEPQRGGVFELCPLRARDAELAAKESGLDTQAFMSAVWRQNVRGLAARPITLKMLLDEFRASSCLPEGQGLLYTRASRRLCAEVDREREQRLDRRGIKRPPESEIFRITCRIAALLMLCGRNAVFKGATGESLATDLPMGEIVEGNEVVDGQKFKVTKEHIEASLDTALFNFRGPDRYGFDHQTFVEFLAAEYLRELPIRKLSQLLCTRLDGENTIAPQLTEMAAWIATGNHEFCSFVSGSEPEVLLRSDVSVLPDDLKERVVAALLARVDREEAFDETGSSSNYHTLRHPKLAVQLRPYINNPKHNVVVRRMAIEIAGDAKLTELEPDLWKLIETRRGAVVHNAIAHALRDLVGPQSRKQLWRALRGEYMGDSADDLKGMALWKLVPDMAPVRDVLPYLKKRRDSSYVGAYVMALDYHLPAKITKEDLPALLDVMKQWEGCFDSLCPIYRLATAGFALALDHLDDPVVAQKTSEMWMEKARAFLPLPGRHQTEKELMACGLADAKKRHQLVEVLFNAGATPQDVCIWDTQLLLPDDLGWLLERLSTVVPGKRETWVTAICQFAQGGTRTQYRELFLATYSTVPELRAALPTPRKYDIDQTLSRLQRARELRLQRRKQRLQAKHKKPSRAELLAADLRCIRQGNATWWVAFAEHARIQDADDAKAVSANLRYFDITTFPGWTSLSDVDRQDATEAARRFLIGCRDGRSAPDRPTNYSSAAYMGIRLLYCRVEHDEELRTAISVNWIDAIMDYWEQGNDHHQEMVALAYRIAPDQTIERLLFQLRTDNEKNGLTLALLPFRKCWDGKLSSALTKFTLAAGLKPEMLKCVFRFWADRDQAAAVSVFETLVQNGGRMKKLTPCNRALALIGVFCFPNRCWSLVFPSINRAEASLSRKVFLEGSYDFGDRDPAIFDPLTEEQLADLYLLLVRLFPPEKFHERNGPDGTVAARHHMPGLRDGVLSALVNRSTPVACVQIQRIINHSKPKRRIWVRWSYRHAIQLRLRKLWSANVLSVRSALALACAPGAALIRDEDELLAVLHDSLDRLQDCMHAGEYPRVVGLWNEPSRTTRNKATPKDETTLSNLLHDWLREDVGRHAIITIGREPQINRIGKLDLKIDAVISEGIEQRVATVIIEVKRCSHKNLLTACRDQLVEKYLLPARLTHGIYLVGWYGTRRKGHFNWQHIQDVSRDIESIAQSAQCKGISITGYALNCQLHC